MQKNIARRIVAAHKVFAIWLACGLAALIALALAARAQTVPPLYTVSLPGNPFGVVVSRDQQWVFVSFSGDAPNGVRGGIAVLRNQGGQTKIQRIVSMQNKPLGMVLTHDGKTLIATLQGLKQSGYVMFFDTNRLTMSEAEPRLGYIAEGLGTASISVNVTADDKTLFVSDEFAEKISVIDLERLRSHGFNDSSKIGEIPVGDSPVALTFSPDERLLYTTSEVAPPAWGWPQVFPRETGRPGKVSEGAVIVIDVVKARVDPRNSVVARVPAGRSPVRLALSPAGDRLFVTARASNAVLVFDTTKLLTDAQHARLATVPVGTSPVPIVLVDGGRIAIVGNSNRYSANANVPSTLTMWDTTRIGEGSGAFVRDIPAGVFPREFSLSADGHTLFLNNYLSRSLQVMDVNALLHPLASIGYQNQSDGHAAQRNDNNSEQLRAACPTISNQYCAIQTGPALRTCIEQNRSKYVHLSAACMKMLGGG